MLTPKAPAGRVLDAEGERQAAILRAEGEAKAIDTVFKAIHEGKPDARAAQLPIPADAAAARRRRRQQGVRDPLRVRRRPSAASARRCRRARPQRRRPEGDSACRSVDERDRALRARAHAAAQPASRWRRWTAQARSDTAVPADAPRSGRRTAARVARAQHCRPNWCSRSAPTPATRRWRWPPGCRRTGASSPARSRPEHARVRARRRSPQARIASASNCCEGPALETIATARQGRLTSSSSTPRRPATTPTAGGHRQALTARTDRRRQHALAGRCCGRRTRATAPARSPRSTSGSPHDDRLSAVMLTVRDGITLIRRRRGGLSRCSTRSQRSCRRPSRRCASTARFPSRTSRLRCARFASRCWRPTSTSRSSSSSPQEVSERCQGEHLVGQLNPGQQVVKIVREQLTELMGATAQSIVFSPARTNRDPDGRTAGFGQDDRGRQAGAPPARRARLLRWRSPPATPTARRPWSSW